MELKHNINKNYVFNRQNLTPSFNFLIISLTANLLLIFLSQENCQILQRVVRNDR